MTTTTTCNCIICTTCNAALGNSSTSTITTTTTTTCTICLGVFQETFPKRLEDAIRQKVEPYQQFVKFDFNNSSNIHLPGDLVYRYKTRHGSADAYAQQLKSFGKDTLRECLKRIEQNYDSSTAIEQFPSSVREEQQGYLGVAVVVLPTVARPPLDKPIHKQRKRRKRTYEDISQGGDPRENLHCRLEQEGKLLWSINNTFLQPVGEWKPPTEEEELPEHALEFHVAVWRRPFYLKSCYTKTRRDVSQTPFVVVDAGVASKRGVTSVEEQIVPIITKHVGGISMSNNNEESNLVFGKCKFHASGREDLDVKMLLPDPTHPDITGRPFVCEVTDAFEMPLPTIVFPRIVHEINHGDHSPSPRSYGSNPLGVGIAPDLTFCPSSAYKNLQAETEDKVKYYGCYCWSEKPVTQEMLLKLTSLFPMEIQQATPIRVLHRRPNLKRTRHVLSYQATALDEHHFQLHISTTAGTYVKEFVHSDLGRTVPSIASLLGCQTDLLELDCEGIQMSSHSGVAGAK